jgi:hypothetical protein
MSVDLGTLSTAEVEAVLRTRVNDRFWAVSETLQELFEDGNDADEAMVMLSTALVDIVDAIGKVRNPAPFKREQITAERVQDHLIQFRSVTQTVLDDLVPGATVASLLALEADDA